MNNIQRILLAVYLPLTVVLLVLDHLYPGANFVYYLKYFTVISLFVTVFLIPKQYPEQKLLTAAVFFIIVGDFFFVFCRTIPGLFDRVFPFGVLGFTAAYLNLTVSFHKKFKIGAGELLAAVPILAVVAPVLNRLYPFLTGPVKYGLILFIFILAYMTWTAMSTVFRGYYTPRSAYRIALAGYLMLICDLGVGLAVFDPNYSGQFVPWLKNIIWGSYIPAWTLVVVTAAEDDLHNS